jgi:hypothetical protein
MRPRIKQKSKLYVSTSDMNTKTITESESFDKKGGRSFSSIQAEAELNKLFA